VVLATQVASRPFRSPDDRRSPVPARVVESSDLAVTTPNHDYRWAEVVESKIVSRFGDVLGAAGKHPHLAPKVLSFQLEKLVVYIASDGNVVEAREAFRRAASSKLPADLRFDAVHQRLLHLTSPRLAASTQDITTVI